MKVIYQLFVYGIPKAQPRPRMTARGHVYNPSSADSWKTLVKQTFQSCLKPTITGPVKLQVEFFMPMPKSMRSVTNIPHYKKPDTDNLLKAVMDSLTSAKVWKDDAQVYDSRAIKYYDGKKSGARIIIETFQEQEK